MYLPIWPIFLFSLESGITKHSFLSRFEVGVESGGQGLADGAVGRPTDKCLRGVVEGIV